MGFVPVETVLVDYLSSVYPDARVCTETNDKLGEYLPVIRVERVGGFDHTVVLDVSRVDVDVFAASRGEARSISEDVRSRLVNVLPGMAISGAVVADVVTTAGPSRAPYDDSALRRFVASYEVTTQSNPL